MNKPALKRLSFKTANGPLRLWSFDWRRLGVTVTLGPPRSTHVSKVEVQAGDRGGQPGGEPGIVVDSGLGWPDDSDEPGGKQSALAAFLSTDHAPPLGADGWPGHSRQAWIDVTEDDANWQTILDALEHPRPER